MGPQIGINPLSKLFPDGRWKHLPSGFFFTCLLFSAISGRNLLDSLINFVNFPTCKPVLNKLGININRSCKLMLNLQTLTPDQTI